MKKPSKNKTPEITMKIDANDLLKSWHTAGLSFEKQLDRANALLALSKPLISAVAEQVGALPEDDKADGVTRVVNLLKTIPEDERSFWIARAAKLMKVGVTSLNPRLKPSKNGKKGDDEEHIEETETLGGYFRNPENPEEGWLVDMVFDSNTQKAGLAFRDPQGNIDVAKYLDIYGTRYYPRVDDFVRKGVVVFPSTLGAEVSTSELLRIHEEHDRHSILLDKPTDYAMAAYYQVFSWVYDCFNELPFLRARGGKDTGKSAIMLRIGYHCYRLAKSTGIGSTASLKHAQELYKCTVFFDEMDIADKFDERIVMLNVRAMKDQAYVWSMKPVTGPNGEQTYEPQAHNVYGPALITMYGSFTDPATDSRCITFDLFGKDISELKKAGIPRRLDAKWHARALEIRNMSLRWRLMNWKPNMEICEDLEDETVSTRANQVTVPIKQIVKDDPFALAEITATVREMYADEILERAESYDARFLEAIVALTETDRFNILEFVHETDLNEFGHAKFIRYPDLALVVNFLINEQNTGIEKDVDTIVKTQMQTEEDSQETDEKGKKKKKKAESNISTKTVGTMVRKILRLPVHRHGRGYVVIVWSQRNPEEVQNRIAKLKNKFGLDLLFDHKEVGAASHRVVDAVWNEPEHPEMPDDFDQMELYANRADDFDKLNPAEEEGN